MTHRTDDIQGRFLYMPYDWRMPTLQRLKARVWLPGGPMFRPKVFGWGWTLNLANPRSWALMAGLFLTAWLIIG